MKKYQHQEYDVIIPFCYIKATPFVDAWLVPANDSPMWRRIMHDILGALQNLKNIISCGLLYKLLYSLPQNLCLC